MSDASDLANGLSESLLAGTDFNISLPDFSGDDFKVPTIDPNGIGAPITHISNADLTSGTIEGQGTFDRLMVAFKAHLKEEYQANRISGAEYTKAYIALTESAMGNATQFLLGRDASYWQAVNAQLAAQTAQIGLVTARVELESAKTRLQVLKFDVMNSRMTYALNKLRLATESVNYDTAEYNLDNLLPQQLAIGQKSIQKADADISNTNKQGLLLDDEHSLKALKEQLTREQVEAARAQTLDTRTDGTAIAGSLGKQKDLYNQQIVSYKRDAENKTAKIFTDAWTVMKTIDEGLAPPTLFSNANLDAILTTLKANNGL